MQEIDDEIEEITAGVLDVDAARREGRAWYKQVVRKLLSWLPEPAGENITEVEYSEVSARRLAAQRACDQLERLKELPNCDTSVLDKAKETFAYWEQSATSVLSRLDTETDIDNVLLARRHSEALARIAAVESVVHLVDAGLLSNDATQNGRDVVEATGDAPQQTPHLLQVHRFIDPREEILRDRSL